MARQGKQGTSSKKLTVGYVRCSSQEQVRDGETMERQETHIRAYCDQRGILDFEVIADEGLSGFKSSRPGYRHLVAMCRSGQVERVIVYDLSRLSRSVRDTLEFIEDTVQKHGIAFVSLQQDLDTSTPMGKAFLSFTAVFNQLYRDEISFKTKLAIHHKRAKNERYSGSVPYGYEDDGSGKLLESSDDLALIELVTSLRAGGMSLRAVSRYLTNQGYRTKSGNTHWHPQTIKDLLAKAVSHGCLDSGCQE